MAPKPVLSSSRIPFEYNEKTLPESDRENAFAGAGGGAVRLVRTGLSLDGGRTLSRAETTPLLKGRGAVQFVNRPAGKAALEIEVVVNGRMDGGDLLKTSHLSEAEHCPLMSSEW